ncbi:MAG: zf-HC2 domain-containing protein [Vicinamibacterales bacterium]
MKVLICNETRPLLQAYHDDELPVSDQIAVGAHLEWCDDCARTFAELRLLRGLLRISAPGQHRLTSEESVAFQSAAVSRARAEERLSLSARVQDALDDMHLVYAGLGAAAATLCCVLAVVGIMRFATIERPDSLAAIVNLLASPKVTINEPGAPGTNENPILVDAHMLMPRTIYQLFLSTASASDEAVFTLSAVITREGRIVNLEWHSANGLEPKAGSREAEAMDTLLNAASLARFEPARVSGLPVAVSMVWLVANTTVRASKAALDLPATTVPSPRKRRA